METFFRILIITEWISIFLFIIFKFIKRIKNHKKNNLKGVQK